MKLRPLSISEAKRFTGKHHRHNLPPIGALFAVGLTAESDDLVGCAIIGRLIARMLQDGWTCEVIRLTTDGTPNACSMLYGAAARAAKALGYRRIITYILDSEPGTSLRAAGWSMDATVSAGTWNRPGRQRYQKDLFGEDRRPPGEKVRWVRILGENSA